MKAKEINQLYFDDVNELPQLDRRDFLKKLGGGLIIVLSLSHLSFLGKEEEETNNGKPNFNVYLRIREDGKVNCYTGKIEMGQGVITSLAQVLAEELDVPFEHVEMIMGDTDLCPYDAGTWGSRTTRFFDPLLRIAAGEAKSELIKLASTELKVPVSKLKAKEGFIVDVENSDKKLSFEALTKGKKIVKTIKEVPELKKPSEYKITGKSVISVDASEKVQGKAKYTADIQLPGMMYAYIVRPPAHKSTLKRIDTLEAEKIEGIEIVKDGDLIAVLHENPAIAEQAVTKVVSEWDIPESKADDKTIFKYMVDNSKEKKKIEEKGNVAEGNKLAQKVITSEFFDGYKAHASVETHAATAVFEGENLVMWVSTQTPFGTRNEVSKALNMPKENVHIKQIFLGGGFGGKIYNQQAVEAAKLAKYTGKPIQVAWSRKEEFMYDRFRPAAVVEISSGVSESGKITSWACDVHCAGARGANLFYNIENINTKEYGDKSIHPFFTGAWRAPANNTNTFARESQIDLMALEAGIDPLDFRLKNLAEPHMINTLKLAAEKFGYSGYKNKNSRGCGIALGFDAGTRVAVIAEVEVDKNTGRVQPLRIVCAQDMGQVVNPHGAKVQTEGGITMGLGYALYEDIQFNWGEVKNQNFDSYEFTRFSVVPEIESYFIDDMEAAPQGGGEPAIICVGGAIANAVFNACGARVFQMPITPERILAAMKK
jgi:nicotinate dehydrogenase subunit B